MESEPDVTRLQTVPEDAFIILASDGLWDVVEDKDSVAIVQVGLGWIILSYLKLDNSVISQADIWRAEAELLRSAQNDL